jgi:DNA-binding transcriptional ArsR family regulator
VIRFHLPASAVERVGFAYSPLFEAVLSLHVLVEPAHHPLQHDWVRRMRHLPGDVRRDVRAFSFAYRGYVPQVLAPAPQGALTSFAAELERLADQRPATIASEFSVPLAAGQPHEPGWLDVKAMREQIASRGESFGRETGRLVHLLLDDPTAFAARFSAFLSRYWKAGFAAEWERIEPILADAVSTAGRQLAGEGLYGFLPRLSAELLVDASSETIAVDRHHEHEVVVDESSRLLLTPSVYVWPHVRVNCDPPWPLALVYPAPALARIGRPRRPAEDLLRVLRALADPARLEMLRLIAARPRSTQELAALVGMTEAGVSRCLRLLGEAGLLVKRRHGRYLLYEMVPERLDLTEAIAAFLTPRNG